jgi:hypothetical protein
VVTRKPQPVKSKKNRISLLLLLANIAFFSYLDPSEAADIKTDISLSAGYRVDELSWNIAGNLYGANPNVLSELTWSNLETLQTTVSGRALVNQWLYVRGSVGCGWTFSGDNQDSDFDGNHRTQEYSRSNNSADGGSVLDAVVGIGYQFEVLSHKLKLIPLIGYSYHEQNLTLNHGFQTISTPGHVPPTPPYGPIQGLDSTYDTSWQGPWLGIDLSFAITDRVTLFGGFEYHWAEYEAEANWNLVPFLSHPKSFEHDADGKGFLITVGAEYVLTGAWCLNMAFNYQKWSTDPGLDHLYYANGSIAENRLNEVNWDSYALMLGLVYRFGYK